MQKGETDEEKVTQGRKRYDAALADKILSEDMERPELIILAGWMHVFSSAFLEPIDKAGVRVINLHPALPGTFQETMLGLALFPPPGFASPYSVTLCAGEFDGAMAIERAFEEFKAGRLTRTGIMAHYVIDEVDKGAPILVKEIEWKGEGLEELKERMHIHEHELIVKATGMVTQEILEGRGT